MRAITIDNIFIQRPRLCDYELLTPEVRNVVAVTVRDHLKSNPQLRVKRFFGTRYVSPVINDFWILPWKDLNELREALTEGEMYQAFKIVFGITEKQFMKLDIYNAFAANKWIVEQLQEIGMVERNMFASDLTPEEKEAGAEELQDYGYTVSVDALAQGRLWMHETILKYPYVRAFRQLCLHRKINEINKNYQENAARKNRVHSGAI